MSVLGDLEGLVSDEAPLLAKYGPVLLPLLKLVAEGKMSEDSLVAMVQLAMTMASDAQMRAELKA